MSWSIPPLNDRGFRATVLPEEVRLGGSCDIAAVEALGQLIEKVHAAALANDARSVVLDIADLDFMSATCFNVLVTWVAAIQDVDPEKRYELKIRSNAAIPWQRRSLKTLACFATNVVTVL